MPILKSKLVENTINEAYETIELASALKEKTLNKTDLNKEILIQIHSLTVKLTTLNRDISRHLSYQNGDKTTLVDLQHLLISVSTDLRTILEANLKAQNIKKEDLLNKEQKQVIKNFVEDTNTIVTNLPNLSHKEQTQQYFLLTKQYRHLCNNGVDNSLVEIEYSEAVKQITNELLKHFNYMLKIANDSIQYGTNKALSINNLTKSSLNRNLTILSCQFNRLEKAGLLKDEIENQYSFIMSTLNRTIINNV